NADARRQLRESLERTRKSGRQDSLPSLRYLSPRADGEDRGLVERDVAVTSVPVVADGSEPRFIAQRIENHQQERGEAEFARRARELRRRNEHLRFAQRVACIGSMEYDIRDHSRTWSEEVYRILGIEAGTRPSPALIAALVHPDDRALLDEARADAMRGKRTEFQHRVVRPDGSIRHVRERVQLVRDEHGEPA